jgi:hypothetical protein
MFNTNAWRALISTSNCIKSTYIQGFLDICGNIVLRNGGFSLTNGDVSMNGNIWVGKNTTVIGDVSMSGNLRLGLDVSFNRNVSIKGDTTTNNTIYQIDGNRNMKISSYTGSFPNYGTTATGPNLINIGNNNFYYVSNLLSDSIAIGTRNMSDGSNPSGTSNIAIGLSNFPNLISGSYNIGIGAYSSYNLGVGGENVYIGRYAGQGYSATGATCIGPAAGLDATGNYMTALGSFAGQNASYGYSGAIGRYAVNDSNYRITLGTASETVDISGGLNVRKFNTTANTGSIRPYSSGFYSKSKIVGFSCNRITSAATIAVNTRIPIGSTGYNSTHINTGSMNAGGIFTAPVSGYYLFHFNMTVSITNPSVITSIQFFVRKNATAYNNGTNAFYGGWVSGVGITYTGIVSATNVVKLNANETISLYTGPNGTYSLTNSTSTSAGSNCYGVLLYAS